MTADEKFFAWLDGELGASEAAEMESRVAADPELARLAEQHRRLGVRLKTAFDSVATAPVPQRLTESARPRRREVVDMAPWRQALARPFVGPLPQWVAMAAMIAVGLFAGTFIGREIDSSPVALRDGQVYAAGPVDEALETQLAAAPSGGPVRIRLTFRGRSGAICRSFTYGASSGLACRSGDDWQVRGLFAAPEGQAGEYRMAAGMDPNLAALIDSTIAGEPAGAAQERTLKERGWR